MKNYKVQGLNCQQSKNDSKHILMIEGCWESTGCEYKTND